MNTSVFDNTFFNSLFTVEEFKFLKDIDYDSQKYESTLKREIAYRDAIVTFINSLREKMVKGESFEENENLSELLRTSQECFDLVNENIKNVQTNKASSDNINKQIVELLISIESQEDNISASNFNDKAVNIKKEISSFTEAADNTNSKLESNDSLIKSFLEQDAVKKYLPLDFDVNNIKIEEEIVDSTKASYVENATEQTEVSEHIETIKENNDTLLVSEKERKVYLPYSKSEVLEYIEQYPKQYDSFSDVVNQEYIFPIEFFIKHPAIARFRETYALIRDRESKTVIDAFKLAVDTMFQHDLNPAIIAACKSQKQLEHYLECLEKKRTDEFNDFRIKFEVTPLKSNI